MTTLVRNTSVPVAIFFNRDAMPIGYLNVFFEAFRANYTLHSEVDYIATRRTLDSNVEVYHATVRCSERGDARIVFIRDNEACPETAFVEGDKESTSVDIPQPITNLTVVSQKRGCDSLGNELKVGDYITHEQSTVTGISSRVVYKVMSVGSRSISLNRGYSNTIGTYPPIPLETTHQYTRVATQQEALTSARHGQIVYHTGECKLVRIVFFSQSLCVISDSISGFLTVDTPLLRTVNSIVESIIDLNAMDLLKGNGEPVSLMPVGVNTYKPVCIVERKPTASDL